MILSKVFFALSQPPAFDEGSFEKIMETCVAISNIGRGHKGYVIVGVAEDLKTAERVKSIFGVDSIKFNGFYIGGVEHEASCVGKNVDQLFQDITDRVSRSSVSEPLKSYINSHIKCVQYYEKIIFVFEVIGQQSPSHWGGKWPERQGTQVKEVAPDRMGALFDRFK